MPADPEWEDLDWPRLGEWVYARRRNRGLRSRGVFAAKAGVSERTLGQLERGLPVGKQTLLAVDAALFWVAGSCERILHGGDPLNWPHYPPGFWDEGAGEEVVAEENPRPEPEIDRPSVGDDSDADSYVATGAGGEAEVTEDEVLDALDEMRRTLDDLERRLRARHRS